jgi:hypothetical protein
VNRRRVAPYVDRLLKADPLSFSFNLKDDGAYVPSLDNINGGVVCTYGGSRWTTFLMGDPPRRFLKRTMRLNARRGRAVTISPTMIWITRRSRAVSVSSRRSNGSFQFGEPSRAPRVERHVDAQTGAREASARFRTCNQ